MLYLQVFLVKRKVKRFYEETKIEAGYNDTKKKKKKRAKRKWNNEYKRKNIKKGDARLIHQKPCIPFREIPFI